MVLSNDTCKQIRMTRGGCKDIWNAFMLKNAKYSLNDIPFCPTTASMPPQSLISYDESNSSDHTGAYVHFYIDDYKFDGPYGIWKNPQKALRRLKRFAGIITPDFSTFQDMPEPLKIYNTFRMRTFGYWLSSQNISVINNVRWGTSETYRYCFDGLPRKSMLSIGTVASGLRERRNWQHFEEGFWIMIKKLQPHTLIIYGSARYPWFEAVQKQGIRIISFQSKMNLAFAQRRSHE